MADGSRKKNDEIQNHEKSNIFALKIEFFDDGSPQVSSTELLLLHFEGSPKPVSWLLLSDICQKKIIIINNKQ